MTRKHLVQLLFVLSAAPLCHAQMNLGKLKPQVPPKTDAGGQTQYSDADKTKMAEIAQRPEVQAAVETAWSVKRTIDLNDAYLINQTADWAIADNPMVSKEYDPREKRLYNNPMMQMYINQIGQRLVPKDSPNLYTFRIILYPIPAAYSLTTGSIYITTGLLSMLDSEAQLSYILGHEIAHVEQRHEYARVRNEVIEAELNKEKEAKAERTKALIDMGSALGGGIIGGLAKGTSGAFIGAALGLGAGIYESSFVHSGVHETDWTLQEENEADALGVKYMLVAGMTAWVVRYALFAYGNPGAGMWMLWLGILLHGICYDFFFVTGQIYIDRKSSPAFRAAAQGTIILITYGVGMLLGSWLSGKVVDLYAHTAPDGVVFHQWRPIWLVSAGCSAAVLILFLLTFSSKEADATMSGLPAEEMAEGVPL